MIAATLNAFIEHAKSEHPREACGLVVSVNEKEAYERCENLAATPQSHFIMNSKDYLRASTKGKVLAVCHSHPNGAAEFSPADLSGCEASGLPWYVLSMPGERLNRVEPSGFQAPLIGREFVHGVHDCYSLIRDYYKENLGIDLPNFEREELWWNKPGYDLYTENFKSAGFREVTELKPHDVILMRLRSKVSNHGAVYVGDDVILHHSYGRLSGRTVYGGHWAKNTTLTLRHESRQ